jgi:hypothetical protein
MSLCYGPISSTEEVVKSILLIDKLHIILGEEYGKLTCGDDYFLMPYELRQVSKCGCFFLKFSSYKLRGPHFDAIDEVFKTDPAVGKFHQDFEFGRSRRIGKPLSKGWLIKHDEYVSILKKTIEASEKLFDDANPEHMVQFQSIINP